MKKVRVRPSTCGVDRDEESAAGLFERTSVYGRSASPTRRPKTEPRRKRPLQTLSLETEEEAPSPFARERQPSLVSPAKASGREMRTGRTGGDLTPSQQKKSFSSSFDDSEAMMDDASYEKYVLKASRRDSIDSEQAVRRSSDDYGDALRSAGVYEDEGDDATTSPDALETYLRRIFDRVDSKGDGEIEEEACCLL